MRPHPVLHVRRAFPLSLALALFMGCSSSKPKEEPPKPEADASNDSKAKVPKPPECLNPSPIVLTFDPSPTGFVNCAGGVVHRAEVHTCPTRLPRTTTCGVKPVDGGLTNGTCRADSDCTTKPKGYCTVSGTSSSCFCDYGCIEDADCGAGYVCFCREPIGECVPATNCASDADCGGLLCLRSNDAACGKTFACQEASDPCTSNSDCAPPNSSCQLQNGHRACAPPGNCR